MSESNAKAIIEEKIAKRLAERPTFGKGIGVPVAIELSGDGGGRWVIDFSIEPAKIEVNSSSRAETTIAMDAKIFEQLAKGEIDPQMAFLSGKVKVEGNLGVAIKLGQLFS